MDSKLFSRMAKMKKKSTTMNQEKRFAERIKTEKAPFYSKLS
jgi:hypothetical protein